LEKDLLKWMIRKKKRGEESPPFIHAFRLERSDG